MEQKNIADLVATLTDGLSPAKNVTKKQLDTLKAALTESLQEQNMSEILSDGSLLLEKINQQLNPLQQPTQPIEISHTLQNEESTLYRIFRREVPVKTSQYAASVPKWAAGQMVDHTLGPFTDKFGKLFWFDFYRRVHHVTVARGSDLFLQIPIRGFLSAHTHYHLAAGSVWIRSQLISATAPAGAFTGLKIKGGDIYFKQPVTISGGAIIMAGSDDCELILELDQPADTPAVGTSTGDDAKNQTLQLPQKVKIICNAGMVNFSEAGDMALEVYGSAYKFQKDSAIAPIFDPVLNRILIGYKGDVNTFSAPSVRSLLFQISETAPISGYYWALTVTVSAINLLGEAAGIGAAVLKLKPGLKADWKSIEKGPVLLNTAYVMSEPGRIAITALDAASLRASDKFYVWEEKNTAKKIRSIIDIQYGKHFSILYNDLSSGNETLILGNAAMQARLDRPVSADKHRLNIKALSATVVLFEIKNIDYIYVQALKMMQQLIAAKKTVGIKPISFALSNALIKTTPVDDFYLFGKWTSRQDINEGTLVLNCPMYFLLPALPDPYVTNYQPFFGNRDRASNQTLSGLGLAAFIQWTDPAVPKLTLLFVPDDTSSDVFNFIEYNRQEPIVATHYPVNTIGANVQTSMDFQAQMLAVGIKPDRTKEIQQEDAQNTAGLMNVFRDRLQLSEASIFLLDVSTNADLFGVGLGFSRRKNEQLNPIFPLAVQGIDLVTDAFNTRIYTLPQVQWEPLWTIQNPKVKPYPFPSPVTSPDTGDPTIFGTESFDLVPIAPKPVIEKFLSAYNDAVHPKRMAALFSLPFGMKAVVQLENPSDKTKEGAQVGYNVPAFDDQKLAGGLQISVTATSPDSGADFESPKFTGATIQTRNLIDLLTGTIPLDDNGNPLSVLGPVVDIIFNNEFKPGGNKPRVPLQRLDISGYGATIFSKWLNPKAVIAATSQARFDVLLGRTSHEVIQVKSLKYPYGVPVVRTITIQRTAGGGITRYDSGWVAQGPGKYDFSYTDKYGTYVPNKLEFHPGIVRGMYHVTEIRDTGRIYKVDNINPLESVIMQEVFFDGDALIDDVAIGAANGYVPAKRQRGFVQLSPYQKPLTPDQFSELLKTEGALGGPVDCVINVGQSGQNMRIVRIDVNPAENFGSKVFVAAGHGSLALPKEGSWSQVKRAENAADVVVLNEDGALPIIREGKLNTVPTQPYRFADPTDILVAASPKTDYALLHSTGSQKILYLRPTIQRDDTGIKSTFQPFFADAFTILNSKGIFPALNTAFPLGAGGTNLQILGNGKLKLTSGGNFIPPGGYTRDLLKNGSSRIYIDYSNLSGTQSNIDVSFDSDAAKPWTAHTKNVSIVVDLLLFKGLINVTTDFISEAGKRTEMINPKLKFASILQPIIDFLSFLGGFDMASAFAVHMGNATTTSWEPKFKAGLLGFKLDFQVTPMPPIPSQIEIHVFGVRVKGPTVIEKEAFDAAPHLTPLKIGLEFEIETHYNMLPTSLSINEDVDAAEIDSQKKEMLSIGASLKIGGEIHILCVEFLPAKVGIYFFGMLEFEFGLDSKEGKSFGFKVAVGVEVATNWPIVGDISILIALGLEMEWKDSGSTSSSGMFALLIFKGEAELLEGLIVIGIHIEAKGGQEKETSGGVEKTFAICEVEFAAEISLAFVIHFEFDVTWQEKKQVA